MRQMSMSTQGQMRAAYAIALPSRSLLRIIGSSKCFLPQTDRESPARLFYDGSRASARDLR